MSLIEISATPAKQENKFKQKKPVFDYLIPFPKTQVFHDTPSAPAIIFPKSPA